MGDFGKCEMPGCDGAAKWPDGPCGPCNYDWYRRYFAEFKRNPAVTSQAVWAMLVEDRAKAAQP